MRRAALAAAALLASCGGEHDACENVNCTPCPPSIVLAVQDPSGQPVAGATISGVDGWCFATPESGETFCAALAAPGTYQVTVSAPGRASVGVTVNVMPASPPRGPSCCGSCPSAPAQRVMLPPA